MKRVTKKKKNKTGIIPIEKENTYYVFFKKVPRNMMFCVKAYDEFQEN